MLWLESLPDGAHITYLARRRRLKDQTPIFYSAGVKTHEETAAQLNHEIYKFDPTHGGHIKATGVKGGKKHFIIDAGSTYMGLGTDTPKSHSEFVVKALEKIYPDFTFTAEEGRGAIGDKKAPPLESKKLPRKW